MAGGLDFGETIDDRLPADSPVLAGLALIVVVAVPLSAAAWSAFVSSPRTDDLTLIAGLALIGWIVVQVAVIRAFSWLQPLYLAIGVALVAASHRVSLGRRTGAALVSVLGAVGVAVGVGLAPHVVDDTVSIASLLSVACLSLGIALLVGGTATAVRHRRIPLVVAAGVVALLGTAVVVASVAPSVAVTNVPPSTITSTPADVGLEYESVTLTTSDDVELAAWYVAGSNGAGLVIRHGAGSTRSDVLDEAMVLADAGYAVLLVDARGHGESAGTAMDFGWYGDLDIGAAVGELIARPDVDPDRIGVVGFSMGGEEAIGAASADDRIRVVVAEGATARRSADKVWLSDVYGWRGWVQERIESTQDLVTDYLTETAPPTPLRRSVTEATHTRFLLVTAGRVADEGHAAEHITDGASGRAEVWTVPEAGHTAGYETAPAEWERRVVGFLDEALG